MQFATANSVIPSSDITISGNLIYRGNGQNTQGIFMGDELDNMPFQNVTITDNLIAGTASSALRPTHNIGVTITNNVLITFAGGDPTNLLVQNSDQITAANNTASSLSITAANGNTNFTETNDIGDAPPVSDQGAAAIQQWLASHPAVAAIYNGSLSVAPIQPRSQLASAFAGYSAFVQGFLAALLDPLYRAMGLR
jgi:hypothetical protein